MTRPGSRQSVDKSAGRRAQGRRGAGILLGPRIVLLASAPAAPAAAQDRVEGDRYQNPRYGIQIEKPPRWHFITASKIMDAARKGNKPIVELESADEQLSLLNDLPDKAGAEFLASTLDSAAETKKLIDRMVKAWKTGDAAGLEKLLITDPLRERPGLKSAYAKLFDERNVKMAAKIEGYLKKSEQPHFLVVGAGHLIGRNGILKLLQKKGYKVEQVKRDPTAAEAPEKPATEKKPDKTG